MSQNANNPHGELTTPTASIKSPMEAVVDGQLVVGQDSVYTSYPVKTAEQKLRFFSVISGDTDTASSYINKVLAVENVTMRKVTMTDDSGEVIEVPQTILHLAGGDNVRFASVVVAKQILTLFQMGFIPPYDPPLELLLERKEIGGGRSMYRLLPVIKVEEDAKAKTKK